MSNNKKNKVSESKDDFDIIIIKNETKPSIDVSVNPEYKFKEPAPKQGLRLKDSWGVKK